MHYDEFQSQRYLTYLYTKIAMRYQALSILTNPWQTVYTSRHAYGYSFFAYQSLIWTVSKIKNTMRHELTAVFYLIDLSFIWNTEDKIGIVLFHICISVTMQWTTVPNIVPGTLPSLTSSSVAATWSNQRVTAHHFHGCHSMHSSTGTSKFSNCKD